MARQKKGGSRVNNPVTIALTRRQVLKAGLVGAAGLMLPIQWKVSKAYAVAIPGGTLDPVSVPKFATPMLIPPVMPKAGVIRERGGRFIDYYEISMRQFAQQILPANLPKTTVWGYGSINGAGSRNPVLLHNAPSLTIEADRNQPIRIKWINDLKDETGQFLPHLLPVDPTLHWANPPGGEIGRDSRPTFTSTPGRYTGPVPMVTHVHGAVAVGDESDGYPEAWFLPAANNIPDGYATKGTWYDFFQAKAAQKFRVSWGPGFSISQYPNANRACTLWYHDHSLGMTRLNVYAGPAGFFIIRGGLSDLVRNSRTGFPALLPGPAPRDGDRFPTNKVYREIPMAIQDRSFNADGSLFYPDSREFFDGLVGPYIPDGDYSPLWNPEFFGNFLMVNGNTWPYQTVEKRRYRFRVLNGCQSRFLILDFSQIPGVDVWAIGNEGGYLEAPVNLTATNNNRLLLGLAERADIIVDFTHVPVGNYVLGNVGPDEPFGGGVPGTDFAVADPETTGQVMQFRVVPKPPGTFDFTTPPAFLQLPSIAPLPPSTVTRQLALIELMGMNGVDADGNPVDGPMEAQLGTVEGGIPTGKMWMEPVTENPAVGAVETWEIYNTTGDAHPIHVHETVFSVINREGLVLDLGTGEVVTPIQPDGSITQPEPWETGFKDTVIAYPGQVTRIKARFTTAGQYVWHCHIIEHEDNEMMRPFRIGPEQNGQPGM